jgi:hypothetical protein
VKSLLQNSVIFVQIQASAPKTNFVSFATLLKKYVFLFIAFCLEEYAGNKGNTDGKSYGENCGGR